MPISTVIALLIEIAFVTLFVTYKKHQNAKARQAKRAAAAAATVSATAAPAAPQEDEDEIAAVLLAAAAFLESECTSNPLIRNAEDC